MSQLQEYFENNKDNAVDKWLHYFDIYDQWFKSFKNKPVVILEIGVFQGGSLKMWRDYFGKEAKIFAIDINPLCKQFETDNTEIFIGSQENRRFLQDVKNKMPKIDILIDDGGHTMNQQIITFEEMYSHINYNGLYLCEDLHTSYWETYGGGFKKEGSFIEYAKRLIDKLNAWHVKDSEIDIDVFTRSTFGLHFYDSILLIEKKQINPPSSKIIGKIIIPISSFSSNRIKVKKRGSWFKRILMLQSKLNKIANKLIGN